jgi:hypothetical protein
MDENETERTERKFSDSDMIMRGLERDIARTQKTGREQRQRKNDENGTDRRERNI